MFSEDLVERFKGELQEDLSRIDMIFELMRSKGNSKISIYDSISSIRNNENILHDKSLYSSVYKLTESLEKSGISSQKVYDSDERCYFIEIDFSERIWRG